MSNAAAKDYKLQVLADRKDNGCKNAAKMASKCRKLTKITQYRVFIIHQVLRS